MNLYRLVKRLAVSASVLAAASFCGCTSDNTKTAAKPDDKAASLVLAENGKTDYQIVIPDKGKDKIVDDWLMAVAKLMQAAFAKNGFQLEVVEEGAKAQDKPGIYLGATAFAKKNGIKVEQHDDWTYYQKAVGKDLIIAGNDKAGTDTKHPLGYGTVHGTSTSLALLGTAKGACDFLREYVGVRFLFMNMDQNRYSNSDATKWVAFGTGDIFNKDGSLKIDTRSIAFTPVKKIAVPGNLDLKKTPMTRANFDYVYETFYHIAMNFFPPLSTGGATASWQVALPQAKYAKSHPEYYALGKDGKRACDQQPPRVDSIMPYCVANEGVQELMRKEIEKLIANGANRIGFSAKDGYTLCMCDCEACNELFGVKAENWDQIRARGDSGKLWQAFFKITEPFRKKYPAVKFNILNYQDTPISAEIIKKFPENVSPQIQFGAQLDFDKLAGVEFPAGIVGFEETFTGFGQAGPFLPERTPEHIAKVVQAMARNHVESSNRDGAMGNVRGMQAPAYYVYGRMMDDPTADWKAIYKEFCAAAFGNVEPQMTRFFDRLHTQIAVYSDFFGVFMSGWSSYGFSHSSKWHVMSMYPPEYCMEANALLTSAEGAANDPDVKARLHLIRIEFDYIRKLSRIFFLQDGWTLNPSQANLDALLDSIDDWHADLEKLAGGTGRTVFQPLSDWPEMRPFGGSLYYYAALQVDGYRQGWKNTCLNWDTKAIRAGILTDKHQLKVATVEEAPGIDSKAWDNAPESVFKVRGDMPFSNARTTLKVLRDKDNLYVRIESLPFCGAMLKKETDGDIFTQEYVELGIMPSDSGGKIYRLAANPVEGSRYDSVFTPDKNNRLGADVKWNGKWEFAFRKNQPVDPPEGIAGVWTAWFKIPFSDFGAKTPAAGETWGFNAARNRIGQYLLWKDAPGVTDTKALGELIF